MNNSKTQPSPNLSQGARNNSTSEKSDDNSTFDGIPEELKMRAEQRQAILKTSSLSGQGGNEHLPDAIRQLFPSEFIFTDEMGWIPKGWVVEILSNITTELRRGISPKYINNGGIRVINQKCIRNHIINYSLTKRNDETKRKITARLLEVGDLLVNSTGVGTLGRMAQILHLSELTVVDSHVTVLRADRKSYLPNSFAQMMLTLEPTIEAMGEGSTGQTELSRKILSEMMVIVPPINIQKILESYIRELESKISTNSQQMDLLSVTRNTLLPKLLSGEVRITKIEKLLEELV